MLLNKLNETGGDKMFTNNVPENLKSSISCHRSIWKNDNSYKVKLI